MERLTGRVILVTGGTGLVGSHVVEYLARQRARIVVPYRSINPVSYFSTQNLKDKSLLVACDIKDESRVFDIVTKYEVEIIIHLAAQPIVPTAYHNPVETISTNVLGTTHILEAARRFSGVKLVIVASSDKAYGDSSKMYVEDDPLSGDHPYESSKSAADLIATSYYKTYKLPVIITRFGNIYGPGDLNFNRIIPGIIKTVLTGEQLIIRSNGKLIRDYIYVQDVVTGYIFLLQHNKTLHGEAFNLSTNDSYSVIDLIKKAEKILRAKIPYKIVNDAVNEIPVQRINYNKILKLGWRPTHSIKHGVLETIAWYRDHAKQLGLTRQ